MIKLRTTFNGKTICVFANIEKDIQVHLANIDTSVNRIYTTKDGFDLISTNAFKEDHPIEFFGDDKIADYRKFNAIVVFYPSEIRTLINMCNRQIA